MRIFKRLLKWLAWLCCIGGLLIVLFLAVPGISVSWRYPYPDLFDRAWFVLLREKACGIDIRQVRFAGVEVTARILDPGFPPPPSRGLMWERGAVAFVSERWLVRAGAPKP